MGQGQAKPRSQHEGEYWEESRQNSKEPGPDPDLAREAEVRINVEKESAGKEQIVIERAG